uniref:Uncharacterized protein n=1 Tax=Arundo donax TaxID=35708 RepID=A0A0A8ZTK2_ARUDO
MLRRLAVLLNIKISYCVEVLNTTKT